MTIVVPKRQLEVVKFSADGIKERKEDKINPRFFKAMNIFVAGNERYQKRQTARRNYPVETRRNINGQNPAFVRILCSDSRHIEENVNLPSGEQFKVESAGNNLGKAENNRLAYASIEYATHFSNFAVLEVERHDDCGAVKATLSAKGVGIVADHGQNIAELIDTIAPAYAESGGDLARAIYINGIYAIENLYSQSGIIKTHVDNGDFTLVGAHYHHDTRVIDQVEVFVPGHLLLKY